MNNLASSHPTWLHQCYVIPAGLLPLWRPARAVCPRSWCVALPQCRSGHCRRSAPHLWTAAPKGSSFRRFPLCWNPIETSVRLSASLAYLTRIWNSFCQWNIKDSCARNTSPCLSVTAFLNNTSDFVIKNRLMHICSSLFISHVAYI